MVEFKDYAKDIKLNLSSVLKPDPESSLTESQIAAISFSCAYATKNSAVVDLITEKFSGVISDQELEAAKAASTIMGMNNIYYRFVHLVGDKEYLQIPPKLRMNVMGNPGVDKVDFELYSLAVSSINGCGMCIESHVKQIEKEGISKKTIQHSIRIAATINAVAQAHFIG